jgi:hypothetical protein
MSCFRKSFGRAVFYFMNTSSKINPEECSSFKNDPRLQDLARRTINTKQHCDLQSPDSTSLLVVYPNNPLLKSPHTLFLGACPKHGIPATQLFERILRLAGRGRDLENCMSKVPLVQHACVSGSRLSGSRRWGGCLRHSSGRCCYACAWGWG